MNYPSEKPAAVKERVDKFSEPRGGPVVASPQASSTGTEAQRRTRLRTGVERIGFWVISLAALAVLLVFLGLFLPPIVGSLITAAFVSSFVGGLALLNLSGPSHRANALMGRSVFPVIRASERDVLRLAAVNAGLTFAATFFFAFLSSFVGPFLAGLLVFGGIVVAGIFYGRTRRVITRP